MRQSVSKDYLKGSSRHHRGHSPFPFDRFLNSRLGRPWDEVYSEVSKAFDHRSYAGYSFFRDLGWHVATNCWIGAETGNIYSSEWGASVVQNEFYVHPWTGILSWAEPIDRSRPEQPKTEVAIEVERDRFGKIVSGKYYEKVDGIWYYFENYSIEHEGFTNIRPWGGEAVEIDGEKLYRVTWTEHVNIKRQLSKKELRENGLHNGSRYNAWKQEEAEKRSHQWPFCIKGS
jgi:hypothetical protein